MQQIKDDIIYISIVDSLKYKFHKEEIKNQHYETVFTELTKYLNIVVTAVIYEKLIYKDNLYDENIIKDNDDIKKLFKSVLFDSRVNKSISEK